MRPQIRQVRKTVDLAEQVTVRNMPLEAEAEKQRLLHHPPLAHHRPNLLLQREENQRPVPRSSKVFQRNTSIPDVQALATNVRMGRLRPVGTGTKRQILTIH